MQAVQKVVEYPYDERETKIFDMLVKTIIEKINVSKDTR